MEVSSSEFVVALLKSACATCSVFNAFAHSITKATGGGELNSKYGADRTFEKWINFSVNIYFRQQVYRQLLVNLNWITSEWVQLIVIIGLSRLSIINVKSSVAHGLERFHTSSVSYYSDGLRFWKLSKTVQLLKDTHKKKSNVVNCVPDLVTA